MTGPFGTTDCSKCIENFPATDCGDCPSEGNPMVVLRAQRDEALAMCEWLVSEDSSDLSYDLVVIWSSWWVLPNKDDPEWAWLNDGVERKRVFHEWLDEQMLQAAREAVRDGQ